MTKRILIILGHPARERQSFCEVLARAYEKAAKEAGHEVQLLSIARLSFDPILHEGYQGNQSIEADIAGAQEKIRWAEHLVIVYPLWVHMVPALLKGFLERTFTLGFAYALKSRNPLDRGLLKGKSARLIQTMGMPSILYRFFFRAHGAKALKSVLGFCGIYPVDMTYFGTIEGGDRQRRNYIEKAQALGRAGD
jgi:NAD(P)H dehydrogenase (quinone)